MTRHRKRVAKTPATDLLSLRDGIRSVRLAGSPPDAVDRARRILLAYVDAAAAQGMPLEGILSQMAAGAPALSAARVELDTVRPDPAHACAAGCAFCCILTGADGGLVTSAEARALHAALVPLAGQPDGRDWHPSACPVLDPETRTCRAYEARPVICRSYVSYDAQACERISRGDPAEGAGVLSPHVTYLLIHALSRAVLAGKAKVPTYALAGVAASAVSGGSVADALKTARHRPRELDDERRRSAAGYARASR